MLQNSSFLSLADSCIQINIIMCHIIQGHFCIFQVRTSLNTTTGSLKSIPGVGGSVNMSKQSMNLTSSMSIPMYSTEYEDEVGLLCNS